MSSRHPDDDPTGIRDLLAGLPDPEPPSDQLMKRISASLHETEQGYLDRFDPTSDHLDPPGTSWWPRLAAAAALAVVGAPLAISMLHHETVDAPTASTLQFAGAPSASADHALVTVVRTGTVYHRGDLASQAAVVTPSARPVGTAERPDAPTLDRCLADLSLHGPTVIDLARFEHDPALVVVRGRTAGTRTVTVLPADCGHGHREPLAGPVPIP